MVDAIPAPVQPHIGDFMIAQPTSLTNTVQTLRIGCTAIGNLSQFFTFEAARAKLEHYIVE
jgi:hypothetical protein